MHVVQVVSEASDAGARGILHHCHTPRLVPQVCDILTGDKNAKLRKHCSAFLVQVSCLSSHRPLRRAAPTKAQAPQQTVLVALCLWHDKQWPALTLWMWLPALLLQVLEGWEPQEYAHYFDQVEAALTAAVQDAVGETRTNGRTAFAAYAAVMPDRASALLRRFDSGLQQKLHEAVVAYGKGHTGEAQWRSCRSAVGACDPVQQSGDDDATLKHSCGHYTLLTPSCDGSFDGIWPLSPSSSDKTPSVVACMFAACSGSTHQAAHQAATTQQALEEWRPQRGCGRTRDRDCCRASSLRQPAHFTAR
jgi:hypothetical protein